MVPRRVPSGIRHFMGFFNLISHFNLDGLNVGHVGLLSGEMLLLLERLTFDRDSLLEGLLRNLKCGIGVRMGSVAR